MVIERIEKIIAIRQKMRKDICDILKRAEEELEEVQKQNAKQLFREI